MERADGDADALPGGRAGYKLLAQVDTSGYRWICGVGEKATCKWVLALVADGCGVCLWRRVCLGRYSLEPR
jgi:hypothetical protein